MRCDAFEVIWFGIKTSGCLVYIVDEIITSVSPMLVRYKVHSTIIFPGSRVSNFAGNLRAQKLNKAQTKRENITGVQYNSWRSTGIGVNFVLSFLLSYICANSHLLSLSIAASSHRCYRGLPLTYCVKYAVQYTVAAAIIPRPIRCV